MRSILKQGLSLLVLGLAAASVAMIVQEGERDPSRDFITVVQGRSMTTGAQANWSTPMMFNQRPSTSTSGAAFPATSARITSTNAVATGNGLNKHVVFIGVDGAQYDQIISNAPQMLAGLYQVEAFTGGLKDTKTEQPTSSGPGWSTLLTGVWANQHGVTENNAEPIRARVDSLFERVDGADLGRQASIVHWPDINTGHFAREMGLLSSPSLVDDQSVGTSDDRVTAKVVRLVKNEAPVFTFAQIDNVDEVGHAVGFGEQYTQALREVGRQIDLIREAVAARQAAHPNEDWMIIISTDHGREKSGYNHGGQSRNERQTFIASNQALAVNGVPPATSVAATILDFLGLDMRGVRGPSLLDRTVADRP